MTLSSILILLYWAPFQRGRVVTSLLMVEKPFNTSASWFPYPSDLLIPPTYLVEL